MKLNEEKSRAFRSKVYFDDIRRSKRVNLDLPMKEPNPNERMDTNDDNDTKSMSSSKKMDIIG